MVSALPASAANRHVDIVSASGKLLKHFHASTTGTDSWEDDILGRDTLCQAMDSVTDLSAQRKLSLRQIGDPAAPSP